MQARVAFLVIAAIHSGTALVEVASVAAQVDWVDCFNSDNLQVFPEVECVVTFDRTYTGNYRNGEPYDYVTISPDGLGETFEETGISIRVRFTCHPSGEPLVGIPHTAIQLFNGNLCLCPNGSNADTETDDDGWTQFTGTLEGGGCAQTLDLYADGIYMCTIPVNINSTDAATTSPCFTDASDVGVLASRLGVPEGWDICMDFNESGPPTLDASDLAFFASHLGAACREFGLPIRSEEP